MADPAELTARAEVILTRLDMQLKAAALLSPAQQLIAVRAIEMAHQVASLVRDMATRIEQLEGARHG